MSRINTNVSSLIAQHTLGRSNNSLQTALTRLSTGLRINSGKDDPAGLIASENLRRDITAINKAISNSERAGQVIATADSALGQVSSLLNDIRGLVSEAANSGALSDEQIAANQLQVDSSLEAIDRISQVTTFQGRRLLDGSLDFLVSEGNGFSTVTDLKIEQANLGTAGAIAVDVSISAAATKAQILNTLPASATGQLSLAGEIFTLQTDPSVSLSSLTVDIDVNNDASATNRFTIDGHEFEATATGTTDDNITVAVSTNDTANFDHGARAELTFDQSTVTVRANAATTFDNTTVAVTKVADGATADSSNVIIGDGTSLITLSIAATANGAAANDDPIDITVVEGGATGANYDSTNDRLEITVDAADTSITATELVDAINAATLDGGGGPASPAIFSASSADADTLDAVVGAVVLDAGGDQELDREEVTATYSAASNTLTLQLNSDLAIITTAQIKAAVDGLTEFNSGNTTVSGPSNITLANVTASSTYGTLTRPTVLASYQDTAAATNVLVGDGVSLITLSIAATADGVASNDTPIGVTVVEGGATGANYDSTNNVLEITVDAADTTVTATELVDAINAATLDGGGGPASPAIFSASSADVDTLDAVANAVVLDGGGDQNLTGGNTLTIDFDDQNAAISYLDVITAIDAVAEFSGTSSVSTAGTINGATLTDNAALATLTRLTTGVAAFFNTNSDRLTLTFDGSDNAIANSDILSAINGLAEFSGSTAQNAAGSVDGTALTSQSNIATAAQVQDLTLRIAGELGSEVFVFQAGTTFTQIANAIQLVSDATGVAATVAGSQLTLTSTNFGSNSFVDVEVISEGAGGTFETNLSAKRATGTDVDARINGVQANGDGNTVSINTATLDMSLTVAEGSSTDVAFTITGGGAVFQLGPGVVSNQQASIGIESVSTGELGGVSGRLYELRSGESKALSADPTGGAKIVDEAITKVTQLRGRLGAFQRTTLQPNIASLQDTLQNLTEAESSIRDADFAAETAALTRAQILVQSGTSVLAIANQNPQNVLALLG